MSLIFSIPCKEKMINEEEWLRFLQNPRVASQDGDERHWGVVKEDPLGKMEGRVVCIGLGGLDMLKKWVDSIDEFDYFRVSFYHHYRLINSDLTLSVITASNFGLGQIDEAIVVNMDNLVAFEASKEMTPFAKHLVN